MGGRGHILFLVILTDSGVNSYDERSSVHRSRTAFDRFDWMVEGRVFAQGHCLADLLNERDHRRFPEDA